MRYNGFASLVDLLREQMDEDTNDPVENMEVMIREIVHFAYQDPQVFEVMRTIPGWEAIDRSKWDAKRRELRGLIESIIRLGIAQGVFADPHPEFTALYIPGFVRSVLLDGNESGSGDSDRSYPAVCQQRSLSRRTRVETVSVEMGGRSGAGLSCQWMRDESGQRRSNVPACA